MRYQKISVGYFYFYIFLIHTTTVVVSYIRTLSSYLDHQSPPFRQEKGLIVPYPVLFLLSCCNKAILIHLPPPPGGRTATRSRTTVRSPPGFALRCTKMTECVPTCPVCTYSHSASTKWNCRILALSPKRRDWSMALTVVMKVWIVAPF